MRGAWPFTGRQSELAALGDRLTAGDGAGVVLFGPAGAGKTRLAREALKCAEDNGHSVAWAAATLSSVNLPFGAFAHLLGGFNDPAAMDPVAVLRAALDTLARASRRRSMVLGVDDAHLLDELSATFVHQLVLGGTVPVVLTVRTQARAPDAVAALWKDELVARMDLAPLGQVETATLLERVLAGPVETLTVAHLWRKTLGNLLFLRQLVDGELEAGRLRCDAGVWMWRGDLRPTDGLTAVVEGGMRCIDPDERRLLELLAWGEPLSVQNCQDLKAEAALRTAEDRGLVIVGHGRRGLEARLAHPLYGEVLRDGVMPLRARSLKADLVRCLAAESDPGRMDLLRLASLAIDSDAPAVAPERLTQAARSAHAMLDHGLAERLARAAVEAEGASEARLVLAYALSWQGRLSEADDLLRAVLADAHTDGQRTRAAIPLAADLFYGLGRPDDGTGVLREALRRVTDQRAVLELSAVLASMRWHGGHVREAAETVVGILTNPAASELAVAWASAVAAFALADVGRADEVPDIVSRGRLAAGASSEMAFLTFQLGFGEVVAATRAGHLQRAVSTSARYRDAAWKFPLGVMPVPHAALMTGQALLATGQLQTAARWLREAAAGAAGHDPGGYRPLAVTRLTHALGMAGEPAAAASALATLERHRSISVHDGDILLAQAWVAAAEGAMGRAVTHAHEAAAHAARCGQPTMEMLALHTVARFGAPAEVVDRLSALSQLDGPLAGLAVEHAMAAAAGDGERLERAADGFESIGALLLAADAAAQAAVAHRQVSDRAHRAAVVRAAVLAERCEGARTPALRAAAARLPLSDREREIAMLAAAGLSNADIADRLVVSVRTVENHLHHSYAKLGIARRHELRTIFPSGPDVPQGRPPSGSGSGLATAGDRRRAERA